MDLTLSDEREALRDAARAFLRKACPPELVRRVRTPDGPGHDPGLWRRMAVIGWPGLAFPPSVGGSGGSLLDLAVVYEEAGRALVPTTLYSTVEAALVIDRAGDDDQRAALLPPVCAGDRIVSLARLEAGVRSSIDGLTTVAVRDGDEVVVDGTKLFVPNAGVAHDLVVVARDPRGDADGTGSGVCLVVVPADAPGITRTPLATFGRDAQHEVSFERVRVPAGRVLAGSSGAGAALAQARRAATALQCVEMVGGARAVVDLTVRYVTDRVQFGRPIGSFQAVQHQVSDVSMQVDAAGLAAWQAVWRCAEGEGDADSTVLADGDGAPRADVSVEIAAVAVSDAYVGATLVAHELHGGVGFAVDHDLHLWSDRARAAALTLGRREEHLRALGALEAGSR
jgi:3-oxocholest-4-en-26-oyl-CoA dehydrogenase beta subunit